MKLLNRLIRIVCILHFAGIYTLASSHQPEHTNPDSCERYIEEITICTDRTLYIAGEPIWFSAFLRCGENSDYECLSQVLYVEVYRGSNSSTIRQKLKIDQGMASGSILIPLDFPTGNYFIRAYTNYQKNYLTEDLTSNEILILNPGIPLSSSSAEGAVKVYFRGGSPVNGIPSRGVVSLGITGDSLREISIISDGNETISPVMLVHRRLGIFEFLPEPEKDYFLKIRFDTGDSLLQPIQNIRNSGWLITADWKNELLHVDLTGSGLETREKFKLVVRDRYMRTAYSDIIQLTGTKGQYTIPADWSYAPLCYISLLTLQGELVTFTEVRKHSNETILLDIETDKPVYSTGETIELTIDGLHDDSSALANVSISVVVNGSYENSGLPDFQTLYHEAISIIHENSIRQNDISVAKLVSENAGLSIRNLPEIRDVSISGSAIHAITNKPINRNRIYLSVLGSEPQLHISETSDDGSFVFSLNHFTGQKKIFVGMDYTQLKDVKILIHNDFLREYSTSYNVLSLASDKHELYEELFINMQVAKKFGLSTISNRPVPFLHQPVFAHPDMSVLMSDYIELSSMEEVFTEIVPDTYLKHTQDSFYFQMKHAITGMIIDEPLVLLDNIPVFDLKPILELSPASIERIDIIRQEYFLGSHKVNGIIHIASREPQLDRIEFSGGTVFFDYQTLSPSSGFVTNAQDQRDTTGSIPRFSNVLYWNPHVVLHDSPVKIEFYSAENESEYQVVLSGITSQGIPCYGERTIQVLHK